MSDCQEIFEQIERLTKDLKQILQQVETCCGPQSQSKTSFSYREEIVEEYQSDDDDDDDDECPDTNAEECCCIVYCCC